MTLSLYGMGVSRGIAIGKAHILQRERIDIPEYSIANELVEKEVERLAEAVGEAKQQLKAIRNHIPAETASEIATFIDAHLLMLDDSALLQEPMRLIRENCYNAERALKIQRDALVDVFEAMDDAYLRTRMDDVDYVVDRVQRILLQQTPLRHEELDGRLAGYIIVADDLAPADTVLMQHHGITAFATEYGGPTSHTSILARSLAIPAIISLRDAMRHVKEDDLVIVDGGAGVMLINPDKATLQDYENKQQQDRQYYSSLIGLKEAPAKTRDGITVNLQANIELPQDFQTVREVGAAGVGLYRTEFLYMNREHPPQEEEHLETYLSVLETLQGLPFTIRTLDLGADKQVDGGRQDGPVQSNPALGLRAVRLCLQEPELFRPQIRAILRASAHGKVRLMLPMLSNLEETLQVIAIIDELKAELTQEQVAFDHTIPVGAMIEVPAAAICADIFAKHLDFLSIGTNDLIQYTIAIDRVNDAVNYLYDPLHPAVLRLIQTTLAAGKQANIPVAMCGEMAGDPKNTRLLLGMGLTEFSLHPSSLLEVKKIIMESDMSELLQLAAEALQAKSGEEVQAMLDWAAE
ncbi:MAG: phosphoenolpyruvate--protein phosphotransferase [Gammaproteobacteria bacterium]